MLNFSQPFHTLIAQAQQNGMKPQRWVLDHQAFSYLEEIVRQNGGRLEPTSRILGLPDEVAPAAKKPVELICTYEVQEDANIQRDPPERPTAVEY